MRAPTAHSSTMFLKGMIRGYFNAKMFFSSSRGATPSCCCNVRFVRIAVSTSSSILVGWFIIDINHLAYDWCQMVFSLYLSHFNTVHSIWSYEIMPRFRLHWIRYTPYLIHAFWCLTHYCQCSFQNRTAQYYARSHCFVSSVYLNGIIEEWSFLRTFV